MSKTGWSQMGRPLKALLITSLALNLAIVGAAGGWMFKWHRHGGHWHGHGGIERQLFRFSHSLPRDRRLALRQYFRERWKDVRPQSGTYKAVRDAAVAALSSEPYDRQKMAEVVRLSHEKRGVVREKFNEAFLDLIDQLTPDERKAFAKALKEDRLPRRHRWGRGRDES